MTREFDELMKDFYLLAESRIEKEMLTLKNQTKYKEKYEKFLNLYDIFAEKYKQEEIDQFIEAITEVNTLENTYMYIRGFKDGLLMKDI